MDKDMTEEFQEETELTDVEDNGLAASGTEANAPSQDITTESVIEAILSLPMSRYRRTDLLISPVQRRRKTG